MNIRRTECAALPAEREFVFSDKTVQGARMGKKGESLYISSPRRFKLFAKGSETLCIVRGEGHIKWKRGEIPFCAGDVFAAEDAEEYDLCGAGVFFIIGQGGAL